MHLHRINKQHWEPLLAKLPSRWIRLNGHLHVLGFTSQISPCEGLRSLNYNISACTCSLLFGMERRGAVRWEVTLLSCNANTPFVLPYFEGLVFLFCFLSKILHFNLCCSCLPADQDDPESEDEVYEVVDLTEYARRHQWWSRVFGSNSGPIAEKYSVATQLMMGGVSGW